MASDEQYLAYHQKVAQLVHSHKHQNSSRQDKLTSLAALCAEAFRVNMVTVWLLNDDATGLLCELLWVDGSPKADPDLELSLAHYRTYFDNLIQQGLQAVEDVRTDPRTVDFAADYLTPYNIHTLLDVPIAGPEGSQGILSMSATGETRIWTYAEQSLASAISSAISLINFQDNWLKNQKQMAFQAHHDRLTGLPNLKSLTCNLEETLSGPDSARTALVWVDLDRFKHVTDALSPDEGNQLILVATERLGIIAREHQGTLARISRDEFALMLPIGHRPRSLQEALFESLRQEISAPIWIHNRQIKLTASIGVAQHHEGQPPESLIKDAESAMLEAKVMGGDQIILHTRSLQEQRARRLALEGELRTALATEQLCIYYQPIFNHLGELAYAEALVRWTHPERGLISPGEFLPMAERAGMMRDLDSYVLERVCADMQVMAQQGSPCRMSINLSGQQLGDEEFPQTVANVLARYDIDGSMIEIEVTERATEGDTFTVATNLQRIAELGIQLSIDDFGTGYSSLSRLKYLPFHKLKIDRSFISDLPDDADLCSMVRAISGLASGLSLEVVAEGVETHEQHQWLLALGCHYYQGFLLGRPCLADVLVEQVSAAAALAEPARVRSGVLDG